MLDQQLQPAPPTASPEPPVTPHPAAPNPQSEIPNPQSLLTAYITLRFHLLALAQHTQLPLLELKAWARRPDIQQEVAEYLALENLHHEAHARDARNAGISTLLEIVQASHDPIERRRAAQTLIRVADPAPRTDQPVRAAVAKSHQPQQSPPPEEHAPQPVSARPPAPSPEDPSPAAPPDDPSSHAPSALPHPTSLESAISQAHRAAAALGINLDDLDQEMDSDLDEDLDEDPDDDAPIDLAAPALTSIEPSGLSRPRASAPDTS